MPFRAASSAESLSRGAVPVFATGRILEELMDYQSRFLGARCRPLSAVPLSLNHNWLRQSMALPCIRLGLPEMSCSYRLPEALGHAEGLGSSLCQDSKLCLAKSLLSAGNLKT